MDLKLSHQLVQAHNADFCIRQRFEVQKVFKFLFVLFLGFFLHGEQNFVARILQDIGNIFRAGFSRFTVFREEPQAQLLDLRGRPFLRVDFAGGFQDQYFLILKSLVHCVWPLCCGCC